MGKVYQRIDGRLRDFIEQQPVFFVATAPLAGDGHVNLSPKGRAGSLTVLGPQTVAYLDFGGSHAETLAHLRENGRITLMWCAFTGPPSIVRIHGSGEPVFRDDPRWPELIGRFAAADGPRRPGHHQGDRRADQRHLRIRRAVHGLPGRAHPARRLLRPQDRRAVRRLLRRQAAQRGQPRRAPGPAASPSGATRSGPEPLTPSPGRCRGDRRARGNGQGLVAEPAGGREIAALRSDQPQLGQHHRLRDVGPVAHPPVPVENSVQNSLSAVQIAFPPGERTRLMSANTSPGL